MLTRGGLLLLGRAFYGYKCDNGTDMDRFSAGFCGSALALKTWAWQLEHGDKPLPGVGKFTDNRGYFENEDQMLEQLKEDLQAGIKKAGRQPKVFVMGALVYLFLSLNNI
jgi:saccharopine dehydrogenase (NAD+, L-lysine-forming)